MTIKNIVLTTSFLILAAACKKPYTCTCTSTLGSFVSTSASESNFSSKKEAEETCKKNENLTGSPKVECNIIQ
ncbi:MAG: hypothetical protein BGO87_01935 [Flavobacteriia bacterium 40-80]|nr:MAG: hypothetical protein BGO87_01935 [Flavobacteriia bacterium 40-80]